MRFELAKVLVISIMIEVNRTIGIKFEGFFRVFSKFRLPGKLHFTIFLLEKLALLPLVKVVTRPPGRKMIKLPTSDAELDFLTSVDILAKIRSRMTTATKFSRQNDAGSRASTT